MEGLADFKCTGHGEGSWIKELVGTWSLRIIWNLKFEYWDLRLWESVNQCTISSPKPSTSYRPAGLPQELEGC